MKQAEENPSALVRRFIDEKLSGEIEELKTYCFADLKGIPPYGVCNGSFDCDNTRLARAIFVLLWGGQGKVYEDMTMENLGSGRKYRGDTMNSFRTVLGSYENGRLSDKILELGPGEALQKEIAAFFQTYHTIGNFTVLPNTCVGGNTLNMYRGKNFGDFFDRFLVEYNNVLENNPDTPFARLVAQNHFPKPLAEMALELFWNDYFTPEGRCQYLFRFCKGDASPKREKYLEYAQNYIGISNTIIANRAEKMVERLKKILFGEGSVSAYLISASGAPAKRGRRIGKSGTF